MKNGLLIGLPALVFQILAQVNIPAVQDFDSQKFYGQWYLIAMVMDEVVIEDSVNVATNATPLANRDILLSITIWSDEMCLLKKVHLKHTQQPGVFEIISDTESETCSTVANQQGYPFETGCHTTVHMVEVDYDSYYILHFTTVNNRILHLYTRRKKKLKQEKKKFKKAARSLGFDLNKMIFETRNVRCRRVLVKD